MVALREGVEPRLPVLLGLEHPRLARRERARRERHVAASGPRNLALAGEGDQELVILVAAKLGTTRLIDNLAFDIP